MLLFFGFFQIKNDSDYECNYLRGSLNVIMVDGREVGLKKNLENYMRQVEGVGGGVGELLENYIL